MTRADQYPRCRPGHGVLLSELVDHFGASFASNRAPVSKDHAAHGIVIDNRHVVSGDIFAALDGEVRHGIEFAQSALEAGACAIWTDAGGKEYLSQQNPQLFDEIPVITSDDPRALVGEIAAKILGHPATDLHLVGITGSNGKTTTAFLVSAALKAHFGSFALRGTVTTILGDEEIASSRTTAEAPELQEFFALMQQSHIPAGVLEVSSHAISLHRISGSHFAAVGFTNLQRDHLDFHGDMENYFQAKLALLHPRFADVAVVNIDDEWGRRAANEAQVRVETLSLIDSDATWRVTDIEARKSNGAVSVGSNFTLTGPDGSVPGGIAMGGQFNVANAALAIVLANRAGVPLEVAAAAIANYPGVPGRMETIWHRNPGPLAIVDYAHAPDSIEAAISATRPLTPGRLIVVIASDGGRDEGKRPFMGEVAARGADVVIVSDDNPRFEDPAKIRHEIISGTINVSNAQIVEADTRKQAVEICAEMATDQDTILLTGKGHETTQEIRGELRHHDDRGQIRELLRRKWS